MVNITLSVSEEVHKGMKQFSEIKWSEVARQAIMNKLETLKLAEQLAKKSKLTREDVQNFSDKIKIGASKRLLACK